MGSDAKQHWNTLHSNWMDNSYSLRDYRRKMYKAQRKKRYISKHFWFFFLIPVGNSWTLNVKLSQWSFAGFIHLLPHSSGDDWAKSQTWIGPDLQISHYQYIMPFTSNSIHLFHVWSLLKCNLFVVIIIIGADTWKGTKLLKIEKFRRLKCRQGKSYYSLVFLLLLQWFSNHSKSIKNPLRVLAMAILSLASQQLGQAILEIRRWQAALV